MPSVALYPVALYCSHTVCCVQMVFLGFMLCGVLGGYLADRYGRWKVRKLLWFHCRLHPDTLC